MAEDALPKELWWARALVRRGGRYEGGILRFPDRVADRNIAYYRAIGGSRITERAHVPFAMTALDTPALHGFLDAIAPGALDAPIVDVGGGDGRNALPWLQRGYRRVVVIDAAGDALLRLRARVAEASSEWLDGILLVEADARDLPLVDGCAAAVMAVESLYYLNDDYEQGLRQCARILAPQGRLFLVERDREGALLMQLLYYGLDAALRAYREETVWDGPQQEIRTRAFTEAELREMLAAHHLKIVSVEGTSLLAMVLGWMNGRGMLAESDPNIQPVRQMLAQLGRDGRLRRTHVVVAQHAAPPLGASNR